MPPRNSRRSSVACKASSLSPCVVVCPIRSPYLIVERGSTKSTFWINGSEVDLACLSGSAITDGANPLNRSQKLVTISKIPIGVSNHHRLTTSSVHHRIGTGDQPQIPEQRQAAGDDPTASRVGVALAWEAHRQRAMTCCSRSCTSASNSASSSRRVLVHGRPCP